MKGQIKFIFLLLFLVTGCVGSMHGMTLLNPHEFQKGLVEAVFNHPFDEVWNATVASISEFPITNLDKENGLITTDWKLEPAPFIFIPIAPYGEGVYRSEIGGSYQQKRERLSIRLKRDSGENTRALINTTVEVYFDNSNVAIAMGHAIQGRTGNIIREWRPAQSDSITEGNILKAIENTLARDKP